VKGDQFVRGRVDGCDGLSIDLDMGVHGCDAFVSAS
jgi:hypothetical protein